MKRIIDGQTYNTDTATIVARYEYEDEKGYETEATLHQTRGGAFFIVHKWAVDETWKYHFETMTREEVNRLVERTDNLEIIDEDAINAPPEAEAESEPGATLYVRVPASLKKRVDEAAKDENVSGNAWAMRCMERCLSDGAAKPLSHAHYIATSIMSTPDGYSTGQINEAFDLIRLLIEDLWIDLKLPREKGMDVGEDIILHGVGLDDDFKSQWQPYQEKEVLEATEVTKGKEEAS